MDDYRLDADGRLPMNSREYQDFLLFVGFADTALQSADKLERRAKLARKGTWRDMRMMATVAKRVAQALFDTIPKRKQKIVHAEMERMVTAVTIQPPNDLPQKKFPNYTTVPARELEWLIKYSLQWECLGCQLEGAAQRRCEFRKHLESLYLFDIEDVRAGECPFRTWEIYSE